MTTATAEPKGRRKPLATLLPTQSAELVNLCGPDNVATLCRELGVESLAVLPASEFERAKGKAKSIREFPAAESAVKSKRGRKSKTDPKADLPETADLEDKIDAALAAGDAEESAAKPPKPKPNENGVYAREDCESVHVPLPKAGGYYAVIRVLRCADGLWRWGFDFGRKSNGGGCRSAGASADMPGHASRGDALYYAAGGLLTWLEEVEAPAAVVTMAEAFRDAMGAEDDATTGPIICRTPTPAEQAKLAAEEPEFVQPMPAATAKSGRCPHGMLAPVQFCSQCGGAAVVAPAESPAPAPQLEAADKKTQPAPTPCPSCGSSCKPKPFGGGTVLWAVAQVHGEGRCEACGGAKPAGPDPMLATYVAAIEDARRRRNTARDAVTASQSELAKNKAALREAQAEIDRLVNEGTAALAGQAQLPFAPVSAG